ncbi:polysaccharide deacetylase family protein [Sphingobacterium sp. E70]|uniref:polysaccharide deacetylase family protein n=1 Tax=Sphingobacterium sp. E70 TaxID=2853439 RepID=UPI0027958447|nr:polysaccharide deacetylase family protein [Sphingobacterium sp. E70]
MEKKVYLTFDDGPIPEITPFILDILKNIRSRQHFFVLVKILKKSTFVSKNFTRRTSSR